MTTSPTHSVAVAALGWFIGPASCGMGPMPSHPCPLCPLTSLTSYCCPRGVACGPSPLCPRGVACGPSPLCPRGVACGPSPLPSPLCPRGVTCGPSPLCPRGVARGPNPLCPRGVACGPSLMHTLADAHHGFANVAALRLPSDTGFEFCAQFVPVPVPDSIVVACDQSVPAAAL